MPPQYAEDAAKSFSVLIRPAYRSAFPPAKGLIVRKLGEARGEAVAVDLLNGKDVADGVGRQTAAFASGQDDSRGAEPRTGEPGKIKRAPKHKLAGVGRCEGESRSTRESRRTRRRNDRLARSARGEGDGVGDATLGVWFCAIGLRSEKQRQEYDRRGRYTSRHHAPAFRAGLAEPVRQNASDSTLVAGLVRTRRASRPSVAGSSRSLLHAGKRVHAAANASGSRRAALQRIVQRFSEFAALSAASTADVVRAWKGLGYNTRAIRLKAVADAVVARHSGTIPRETGALRALPGVGAYTAAAIRAFAFDLDDAPVDTNVRRIVHRFYFGIEHPAQAPPRELSARARALVPAGKAHDWNSSLMDLGATICTARAPQCPKCPLRRSCAAAPIDVAALERRRRSALPATRKPAVAFEKPLATHADESSTDCASCLPANAFRCSISTARFRRFFPAAAPPTCAR